MVEFADELGKDAPKRSREKLREIIAAAPLHEKLLIEAYELGHWDGEKLARWAAYKTFDLLKV